MNVRSLTVGAAGVMLAGTISACGSASNASSGFEDQKVCVDQYTTSTVITDILNGLKSGLSQAKSKGLEITIKNPHNDVATEQTIAQQFITGDCDVIVPVGTAAAQLQANMTNKIPIVFAASSTPVRSGLVESLDKPGGNVTGVSDPIDPAHDINAMTRLMPKMDEVGLIWKLGDPAGESQTAAAKARLKELNIDRVSAPITRASQVVRSAQVLVDRGVDAIEIPGDTTTLSAAEGIIEVASDAGIPVFGGTGAVVEHGGVLSTSYKYTIVGELVADIVLKILGGADTATMPVKIPDRKGFVLNVTKLKSLGIPIPDGMIKDALKTY